MSHYVYDAEFAEERQRLGAMETLWDPGTRRVLTDIGVAPGFLKPQAQGSIACPNS